MPVIVNNYVGDAASYIRKRDIGIVLSDADLNLKNLEEFEKTGRGWGRGQ